MGDVIRLFQNKDTVALLRALTIAAVNGDLIGVDVQMRMKSGREAHVAAGPYSVKLRPDGTDGPAD